MNATVITEVVPTVIPEIMGLPGRRVTAAEVESGMNLRLTFDNDQVLTCIDDSRQYESYALHIGDLQIIA